MKKLLAIMMVASSVYAEEAPKNEWTGVLPWQNPSNGFAVAKKSLGSGEPMPLETDGLDAAVPVADGMYHTPNNMPGFPTAATLWPRVQSVDCDKVGEKIVCDGYNVNQATGRGEYIYIQPNVKPTPVPVFIEPKFTPVPKKSIPKKPLKIHKKIVKRPLLCK